MPVSTISPGCRVKVYASPAISAIRIATAISALRFIRRECQDRAANRTGKIQHGLINKPAKKRLEDQPPAGTWRNKGVCRCGVLMKSNRALTCCCRITRVCPGPSSTTELLAELFQIVLQCLEARLFLALEVIHFFWVYFPAKA